MVLEPLNRATAAAIGVVSAVAALIVFNPLAWLGGLFVGAAGLLGGLVGFVFGLPGLLWALVTGGVGWLLGLPMAVASWIGAHLAGLTVFAGGLLAFAVNSVLLLGLVAGVVMLAFSDHLVDRAGMADDVGELVRTVGIALISFIAVWFFAGVLL